MKKFVIFLLFATNLPDVQVSNAQVFIQNNGVVACTGNPVITIQNGDLINNGDFFTAAGKVVFNGTTENATIGGSHTTSFHILELDKDGRQLFLDSPIEVRGNVVFQNGLFDLNGFDLDLKFPATLVDEHAESRIVGPNGGETVLHINLEPLLTFNPGNMGIRIFSTENMGFTTIRRGHVPAAIGSNLSAERYFSIEPANNTNLNATVRIYYFDPERIHIPEAELSLWRNDGADWEEIGATDRDATANYVERSGIDHFSTLTLSNAATALPVEWLTFRAFVQDETAVLLKWETAQEHNNLGFDVERQLPDGTGWKKLGFVAAAAGNYQFLDKKPFPGINYYRLKQWDNDGSFSYSSIVSAEINTETFGISVYPNPASEQINIETGGGVISLKIYDALGRLVVQKPGSEESIIHLQVSDFPPGTYWLEAEMQGRTKRVKWVKS